MHNSLPGAIQFMHEQEKHQAYDEHIRKVKTVCFRPLIFGATYPSGMGPPCWLRSRVLITAEFIWSALLKIGSIPNTLRDVLAVV